MDNKPLLKLIIGNIRFAYFLGMIECNESWIETYVEKITNEWNHSKSQETEYTSWMKDVKTQLFKQFRPLQSFKGETVLIRNVLKLGDFSTYWLDPWIRPMNGTDEYKARNEIIKWCEEETPVSKDELVNLNNHFDKLNKWIASTNTGVPIRIGSILDSPDPRKLWASIDTTNSEISAQFWRDRLGLIHIGMDNPVESNYPFRELLVMQELTIELPNDELPREQHLEHRKDKASLLWLFRPSVVHLGNKRFVQGVLSDNSEPLSKTGRTRVLSPDYPEGEKELLLLAGDTAQCHINNIYLLDGFVHKKDLDNEDEKFINAISTQFKSSKLGANNFYL